MAKRNLIERARAYVEASNAHDLDIVQAMFAETAEYHSDRVGSYQGIPAIRAMMDNFFRGFPDVHWRAEDYRLDGSDGVTFDFVMTATNAATGEAFERRGVERIYFDAAGAVRRIEVET